MADVSIDGSIATTTAHYLRTMVFTTASIGYRFYTDGDDTFVYSKTTDGGATWGAAVQITTISVNIICDVWYDKWTPGDTGNIIHCVACNTTLDDVQYCILDTSDDSQPAGATIFAGLSAVASNGTSASITKSRSGYLYCCYNIDGGTEFGFKRSTDGGGTWSADLGGSFNEGSTDHFWLYPATGTGDDNDIWAVYHDSSALAATMKMWDSSAAAQVESSTVHATATPGSDVSNYQYPSSGSVRHSDGALFCVGFNEARDSATGDLVTFEVTAVNSGSLTGITSKTNITTNIDDIWNPSVFINQANGNIYVAYNGKRDGSEVIALTTKVYYTLSTDGGTSWSAGDTAYMEGAAGVVVQTWAPLMGARFYVSWRVGTTLLGNFVNSIAFATTAIKTILGLVKASVKTVDGLAIASVKTVDGLT